MVRRLLTLLDLPNSLGVLDFLVDAIDCLSASQRRWLHQQLDDLEVELAEVNSSQARRDCDEHRRRILQFLNQIMEINDGPDDLSLLRIL